MVGALLIPIDIDDNALSYRAMAEEHVAFFLGGCGDTRAALGSEKRHSALIFIGRNLDRQELN